MTIEFVGWTLIHSVWEGALIAALLAATLRLARHGSASTRYAIAVVALGAVLVGPVATTVAGREPARNAVTGVPIIPASLFVGGGTRTPSVVSVDPRTDMPRDFSNFRAIAGRVDSALPWIVAVWLAGVVVLSLRLIGGVARTRRLARTGVASADARVVAMAKAVAERLGIRAVIRILESTHVDVPMVVGWVSPVVLIPATLLTGLAPAQLEMLLAHELAHVRRFDTIVNLAQRIIETLLFYHPAVWWISGRIRDERENCCDDLAIAVTGNDRAMYGTTLLMLEELRSSPPMLATAAAGGSLLRRVQRLVGGEPDHVDLGPRWLAAMITILAVLIAAGTTNARAISHAATRHTLTPRTTIATPPPSAVARVTSRRPVASLAAPSAPVARDTSHRSSTMPRQSVLISAAALTLASANVAAQPRPDFAGKWMLVACDLCADSSVATARRNGGSLMQGWGAEATVLQDDRSLTVIRSSPTGDMSLQYRVGGPAARIFEMSANGKAIADDSTSATVVARSNWNGDKLVITETGSNSWMSIMITMTLSLDAAGDLTVQGTVREAQLKAAPGARVTFVLDDQAADGKSSGFQLQRTITLRYRKV
jgi:beta-lactamase regulating signal transducer with metallopeptidase domain